VCDEKRVEAKGNWQDQQQPQRQKQEQLQEQQRRQMRWLFPFGKLRVRMKSFWQMERGAERLSNRTSRDNNKMREIERSSSHERRSAINLVALNARARLARAL
jgi:hypothetical protein